jgi:hypothetical protein
MAPADMIQFTRLSQFDDTPGAFIALGAKGVGADDRAQS